MVELFVLRSQGANTTARVHDNNMVSTADGIILHLRVHQAPHTALDLQTRTESCRGSSLL